MALGREMKVLLVFFIVLIAAATAFAYGHAGVSAGVSAVASHASTEPTTLLLSGRPMIRAHEKGLVVRHGSSWRRSPRSGRR